ncbi:MAG: DnaJ domain-containing protein [Cyanobacteriota bacterium]|nr:DnaJ domain-containing protein [Cyanobacteriota bacterium]
MTSQSSHYHTLEISPHATNVEIKQAYRRLVKRFHPDSQSQEADSERIVNINAAYEVVSDPQRRQNYDRELHRLKFRDRTDTARQERTVRAQEIYRQQRQTQREREDRTALWYRHVYLHVDGTLSQILKSLKRQIQNLAADPFDDELMEDFQNYLADCRQLLNRAQQIFASQPNPPELAAAAAHLYYCLDRIGDGLDEFNWFTLNYDDRYVHSGTEMFRIASQLQTEAKSVITSYAN